MLDAVTLNDWKSFGKAAVPLARVTFLVGTNAAGKSNFFDALRFMQGAALDLPISEVLRGRWEGGREIWQGIRGGLLEAARSGCGSFLMTTEWTVPDLGVLVHGMLIDVGDEPAIDHEVLEQAGVELFSSIAKGVGRTQGRRPGGAVKVAFRARGKGASPTAMYATNRSVLGQIAPVDRMAPGVVSAAHAVRQALRDILFVDIQPARMRGYSPSSGAPLSSTGDNLSAVLERLCQDERQRADLVDWLSELCAPQVENIDFVRTELHDVMLVVVEHGGRRVSARSLSDGTLRFLGELAALLTCPEGSIVLLEEPDVGLHPPRVHLLAQILETVSARRNLQVIATTHSPSLLEHLSPETLANAVAFARDAETGLTKVARLGDLKDFPVLRDSKNLAHLFSTGWVEQAL